MFGLWMGDVCLFFVLLLAIVTLWSSLYNWNSDGYLLVLLQQGGTRINILGQVSIHTCAYQHVVPPPDALHNEWSTCNLFLSHICILVYSRDWTYFLWGYGSTIGGLCMISSIVNVHLCVHVYILGLHDNIGCKY